MTGVIVFAHGSRVETANQVVRDFVGQLKTRAAFAEITAAFLELGEPDLPSAFAAQVSQGIRDVIIVPYFLTPGIHLRRDLPRIVSELSGIYPGVSIAVADPLDGHPALVDIVLDRAGQMMERRRERVEGPVD